MNNNPTDLLEYKEKMEIKGKIDQYYKSQEMKNGLESLKRIKSYLPDTYKGLYIMRNIVFAHLDFGPILELAAEGREFTVVSGLNPSSPLHLGHKVLFDILLFLQSLGGRIFIPITNDESFVDGKTKSLSESRRIAYQEIIPSIIAFGFDPEKTHIFVDSDYPDLYNFAIHLSNKFSLPEVTTVFGENSLNTPGQIFYRSAVQMSQILMPQLPEFGGPKPVLIPVGVDQHPYILLARDTAKKMKLVPSSELVFKFLPSLRNPENKMSGSKPETAIYLTDTPDVIRHKIDKAYTGSLSSLTAHRKLGAIPEICSVFSLFFFHHPDKNLVSRIYRRYKSGKMTTSELKEIVKEFITNIILDHQDKKKNITANNINSFLLKKPLRSFLEY